MFCVVPCALCESGGGGVLRCAFCVVRSRGGEEFCVVRCALCEPDAVPSLFRFAERRTQNAQHLHVRRVDAAREETSEAAADTGSAPLATASSIAETIALPTTTPSARDAAARTSSGAEMPNSTAKGSFFTFLLTRPPSSASPSGN